jgi:sugar O-acyltransferase (sialic acid O-acetyltransferase NeuD family)
MKDIAIFGAGGFGREVYLLIKKINQSKSCWNFIGFFDDNDNVNWKGSKIPFNYLGGIYDVNDYKKSLNLVIAIGDPMVLYKAVKKINNPQISYPNIISEDSIFYDEHSVLGIGNIITSGCIFTDNIIIGNFNIFNSKITVGHDVQIGDFNVFNPNAAISGDVTINNCNFFGLNSSIVQGKTIGSHNKIGASTLMIRNAKDNEMFFGVPGTLNSETLFKDVEGWDSMTALSLIAMVDEEYSAKLSGDEIRKANTVKDIFFIVSNKK